jgi:hypothetical protein
MIQFTDAKFFDLVRVATQCMRIESNIIQLFDSQHKYEIGVAFLQLLIVCQNVEAKSHLPLSSNFSNMSPHDFTICHQKLLATSLPTLQERDL